MLRFGVFFYECDGDFPCLVRNGENVILQDPRGEQPKHTFMRVYQEMLLTITMNYNSLPDVRTMTVDEIEFFYEGIRGTLIASTKKE